MANAKRQTRSAKESYTRTIKAHITPRKAFKRIADVRAWWTAGYTGKSAILGDKFRTEFGEIYMDYEIVEVVPDKHIVWLVTDCYLDWVNSKEWNGTRIVWDLSSVSGITTVTMIHQGLTPDTACYDGCEIGWDFFIGESLQRLLETGKGIPDGI